MFTGTSTIADSIMTQAGSTISVAGTLAATTLQGDGAPVTNVDGFLGRQRKLLHQRLQLIGWRGADWSHQRHLQRPNWHRAR